MIKALFFTVFILLEAASCVDHQPYFVRDLSFNPSSVPSNWQTRGHTVITDRVIRLTTDGPSQNGAIYSLSPVTLPHWEVHIEAKVHSTQGKRLGGDGFAFWYIDKHAEGTAFGSQSKFKGLGIFFDTYKNGDHNRGVPFIMAMLNDGTLLYDHNSDGLDTSLGYCGVAFRNKHSNFLIRYHNEVLSVHYDVNNRNEFTQCFSIPNVILPKYYTFGLSAATGDLHDSHDIYHFKTYELAGNVRINDKLIINKPQIKQESTTPESTLWWLTKNIFYFGFVIGIIAVAVISILYMLKKREAQRKRFY